MNCPYCYRSENTWKKDPILIPNGSKFKWQNETTLVEESDIEKRDYKGIYQISYEEIKELQDYLKDLEEENLAEEERTEFSSINDGGIFQFTGKHLKEMRDSVEKLLESLGLEKTDYFNYDEEGNHITHPNGDKTEWVDPITSATDLKNFQIKAIHIEDLRHFIQSFWKESWNIRSSEGDEVIYSDEAHLIKSSPFDDTFEDINTGSFEGNHLWTYLSPTYIVSPYFESNNVMARIVGGGLEAESLASMKLNKNFSFYAHSYIKTQAVIYYGRSTSLYSILCVDMPGGIKIKENTNLIIENLNFNYTRSSEGDYPFLPDIPQFSVFLYFTDESYVWYIWGQPGASHSVNITSSPFSGNFQRNIYNDLGGKTIAYVRLIGGCAALAYQPYAGITSWDTTLTVSHGTIKIKNVTP